MPGAVSKKDLYIGKSMGDLNSYTEVKNKTSNVSILIKSAEKTFREAERSDELGDEERAYILFMKYFNVLTIAKTKPDYKKQKDYFDSLIGSKNQLKAIDRAEKLANSLKERYELLEAKAVAEKLDKLAVVEEERRSAEKEERRSAEKEVEETKEESASSKGNNSQNTNGHDGSGAAEVGQVTVQKLYQMLTSHELQLLILDTRPEQDFAASHIKDRACISVPQEIVKPGSTVRVMEKLLPEDSLLLWRQRSQMDKIILLDWNSCLKDVTIGTTLRTLRDALFKYDSTVILRQEPMVLEGGYEQFMLFYPMLSTNPHVSPPSLQPSSTNDMLDFDYPDFEDPKPDVPPEESFSKKTPSTPDDVNLTRPALPKVDRSTKPQIIPRRSAEGRAASPQTSKGKLNNAGASGRTGGRGEVEGGEGVSWINNPLYPSVSSSNLPRKRSNLAVERHTATDAGRATEAGGVEGDMEFELSELSRIKQEKERELSAFKKERERLVAEQKARIARLKEEEGKLEDLAALRRKEERDVVDLMRRKRSIEDELSSEKERSMKDSREKEQEEAARLVELSRIQAEEREKKKRQEEVERLRQDRKKREEDRKKLEAHEKEARENAEWLHREEEATKERQLREASEMADKLRAEEEKARLAKEEEEEERKKKEEEERKKKEETLRKEEEKTLAAKLDQEKERLEKERREKERPDEQREKERQEREKQKRERLEKERQERMEREKMEKEKIEKERQEKDRQEKERLERERQEKERLLAEKTAHEAEEKARAEPAKQEASQAARHDGTDHLQPKMIPSTNLPSGWEKRWDRSTNRYFYINHNEGTTQWEPPPTPYTPSSTPGTYKTRLKEEPEVSSSRGMSRSHSSPDIMKLLEEEEDAKPSVPLVDRTKKPSLRVDTQTSARSISQQRHMARKRDFNPVYGNVGPALTGLRNLGNTCYMNSTIQCLANTPQLVTFFLTDQYIPFINRDGSESYNGEVVDEFAAVVKALWCGTYRCIVPRDLKITVGRYNKMFGTFDQQDSQEFLTFLLDGLHEGLNEVKVRPQIPEQNNDNLLDTKAAELAWDHHKCLHSSIIVELFQGQLRYTNTCDTCGFQSKTFQAFMFLSLPLPSASRITLKDCLNQFLKPEHLTDWNCPRCKVPRHALKKIDIWKLPRILIICLMRFSCSGYGLLVEKICDYVDFPVTGLDLREQVVGQRPRSLYNLYGISNHFGSTGGGHYTAVCRNPCSMNWHKFDDSEVTEIPPSKIKSSAAYLLFYTSLDSVTPQIKTHM